ncbi:MAG: substrate-binding domain-containing protein [Rickettsiales bacterium]|nr:substrate-binding domain-containing protein [Rickettsiales bacterium]
MKQLSMIALVMMSTLPATPAFARDQIRVVGSGTVFPFVAMAAEQFGKAGKFRTPVVEATGTGGGFKLFCSGTDLATADMSNASRPMLPDEEKQCEKNGVVRWTQLTIGYDGIAIARKKQGNPIILTKKDLFLALAHQVPVDGKLVANPYTRWREVNPGLPDIPIKMYGTTPTSGTRDTFVELVMHESCEHFSEFKTVYPDKKKYKAACGAIREDGVYIEAGEDYNATAKKLINDPQAFAIFGYSFLDQNASIIQGMLLDGAAPSFENIANGKYGLSRKLYVYVKNDHVGQVPGLAEFARELTSEAAVGTYGYIVDKGAVPLPEADRAKQRALAAALKQ